MTPLELDLYFKQHLTGWRLLDVRTFRFTPYSVTERIKRLTAELVKSSESMCKDMRGITQEIDKVNKANKKLNDIVSYFKE